MAELARREDTNGEEKKKKLILQNQRIIILRSLIDRSRRRSRYSYLCIGLGILLLLSTSLAFLVLGRSQFSIIEMVLLVVISATPLAYGSFLRFYPGVSSLDISNDLRGEIVIGEKKGHGWKDRWNTEELELGLQVLRENRRLEARGVAQQVHDRRAAYREDALIYTEELRSESRFHSRVNSLLQVVVIGGSLLGSALAGTSLYLDQSSIWFIGTSLAVGMSSGVAGYFKFKEKGFYAKQTADSIEHEIEAFDVGLGKYSGDQNKIDDDLAVFAEEIHRLKLDQRKREQNLDQSSTEKEEKA